MDVFISICVEKYSFLDVPSHISEHFVFMDMLFIFVGIVSGFVLDLGWHKRKRENSLVCFITFCWGGAVCWGGQRDIFHRLL